MNALTATNEQQARREAVRISQDNPGRYVLVFVDFGTAYADVVPRLNVHAPSDSTFDWYVLNGKVKTFSTAKRVADQNATPTLY